MTTKRTHPYFLTQISLHRGRIRKDARTHKLPFRDPQTGRNFRRVIIFTTCTCRPNITPKGVLLSSKCKEEVTRGKPAGKPRND